MRACVLLLGALSLSFALPAPLLECFVLFLLVFPAGLLLALFVLPLSLVFLRVLFLFLFVLVEFGFV